MNNSLFIRLLNANSLEMLIIAIEF